MPETGFYRPRRQLRGGQSWLTEQLALLEADRCLQCKDPRCIKGCPVGVNIPRFIDLFAREKSPTRPKSHVRQRPARHHGRVSRRNLNVKPRASARQRSAVVLVTWNGMWRIGPRTQATKLSSSKPSPTGKDNRHRWAPARLV